MFSTEQVFVITIPNFKHNFNPPLYILIMRWVNARNIWSVLNIWMTICLCLCPMSMIMLAPWVPCFFNSFLKAASSGNETLSMRISSLHQHNSLFYFGYGSSEAVRRPSGNVELYLTCLVCCTDQPPFIWADLQGDHVPSPLTSPTTCTAERKGRKQRRKLWREL